MAKKIKKPPTARNLIREKAPVQESTDKTNRQMFPATVEKYIRLADTALGKKADKP